MLLHRMSPRTSHSFTPLLLVDRYPHVACLVPPHLPPSHASASTSPSTQPPPDPKARPYQKPPLEQQILNGILSVSQVPYSSYVPTPVTFLHKVDARIKQLWLVAIYLVIARSSPPVRAGVAIAVAVASILVLPRRLWTTQLQRLGILSAFLMIMTGAAMCRPRRDSECEWESSNPSDPSQLSSRMASPRCFSPATHLPRSTTCLPSPRPTTTTLSSTCGS